MLGGGVGSNNPNSQTLILTLILVLTEDLKLHLIQLFYLPLSPEFPGPDFGPVYCIKNIF